MMQHNNLFTSYCSFNVHLLLKSVDNDNYNSKIKLKYIVTLSQHKHVTYKYIALIIIQIIKVNEGTTLMYCLQALVIWGLLKCFGRGGGTLLGTCGVSQNYVVQ